MKRVRKLRSVKNLRSIKKYCKLLRDTKNLKERKHLLAAADTNLINALTEIIYNIRYGYYPMTNKQKALLHKHIGALRKLTNTKVLKSIRTRKGIIYKQRGGFLSAILPIAISAISTLLSKL